MLVSLIYSVNYIILLNNQNKKKMQQCLQFIKIDRQNNATTLLTCYDGTFSRI